MIIHCSYTVDGQEAKILMLNLLVHIIVTDLRSAADNCGQGIVIYSKQPQTY
jgi:hypothetical protein